MNPYIQRPRLRLLMLCRLPPACRPAPQGPKRTRVLPPDCRVEVRPPLVLRVVEDPDARVDFADDLLGVGVNILAVAVGEVALSLACSEVRLAGLRGGEVGLSDVFELVVEVGDVRVLRECEQRCGKSRALNILSCRLLLESPRAR